MVLSCVSAPSIQHANTLCSSQVNIKKHPGHQKKIQNFYYNPARDPTPGPTTDSAPGPAHPNRDWPDKRGQEGSIRRQIGLKAQLL